jgi:hypothetical protein
MTSHLIRSARVQAVAEYFCSFQSRQPWYFWDNAIRAAKKADLAYRRLDDFNVFGAGNKEAIFIVPLARLSAWIWIPHAT